MGHIPPVDSCKEIFQISSKSILRMRYALSPGFLPRRPLYFTKNGPRRAAHSLPTGRNEVTMSSVTFARFG